MKNKAIRHINRYDARDNLAISAATHGQHTWEILDLETGMPVSSNLTEGQARPLANRLSGLDGVLKEVVKERDQLRRQAE